MHGSRRADPSVESRGLSLSSLKVLGHSTEAAGTRKKAKELAEITGKVGGRKKACEKIIELLGASYRGRKLLGGQALVDPIQETHNPYTTPPHFREYIFCLLLIVVP